MRELERTYLAKEIPEGLQKCKHKEIIDIYIPKSRIHPTLRIRKNGDSYEITKKEPVSEGDSSDQIEQTIELTKEEFDELTKLDGKRAHKVRYFFPYGNKTAEIDVFQGELKGLVLVDFEFDSEEEKSSFEMPDFCMVDVTQEKFVAGGMLCGKAYRDIELPLAKFKYKKLSI
jgi:CYTH domain-containing protein